MENQSIEALEALENEIFDGEEREFPADDTGLETRGFLWHQDRILETKPDFPDLASRAVQFMLVAVFGSVFGLVAGLLNSILSVVLTGDWTRIPALILFGTGTWAVIFVIVYATAVPIMHSRDKRLHRRATADFVAYAEGRRGRS